MIRWVIFIIVTSLLSYYTFQAIKTVTKNTVVYYVYLAVLLLVFCNFAFHFIFGGDASAGITRSKSYALSFVLIVFIFQLVTVVFLFSEDIIRFIYGGYKKLAGSSSTFEMPSRRKFLSVLGLSIAALPFGALLYGMYKGKYNYKVLKYSLEFDDLPDAFDGYQITQISDIHSGSFDNREKIEYAINLINDQKSDVLFFTGDMVNNKAEEMEPWQSLFAKLHAKDGKYSVLGNHDYGDYVPWENETVKAQNLSTLIQMQKDMGFDILLNEHRFLEKDGERIALVGVENWGRGGFKKAGDLTKAAGDIDKKDFKILLSHDPSHWEDVVLHDDYHYHLTLSGHTHGMQFGIEIPGWIKWSPVKWRYKYWAGIYKEMGQYINVNRGFGFLGYPGRVGIMPEISVILLKKKKIS